MTISRSFRLIRKELVFADLEIIKVLVCCCYLNTLLLPFIGQLPGEIQDIFCQGSEDHLHRRREVSS
jgi:hypothetical protein